MVSKQDRIGRSARDIGFTATRSSVDPIVTGSPSARLPAMRALAGGWSGGAVRAADVIALQRAVGNQNLARLLGEPTQRSRRNRASSAVLARMRITLPPEWFPPPEPQTHHSAIVSQLRPIRL